MQQGLSVVRRRSACKADLVRLAQVKALQEGMTDFESAASTACGNALTGDHP